MNTSSFNNLDDIDTDCLEFEKNVDHHLWGKVI